MTPSRSFPTWPCRGGYPPRRAGRQVLGRFRPKPSFEGDPSRHELPKAVPIGLPGAEQPPIRLPGGVLADLPGERRR